MADYSLRVLALYVLTDTVAGLPVLLVDGAVSAGLRSAYWPMVFWALRRFAVDRVPMRAELVKMFSTREEIDGEREPRVSR